MDTEQSKQRGISNNREIKQSRHFDRLCTSLQSNLRRLQQAFDSGIMAEREKAITGVNNARVVLAQTTHSMKKK